MSCRHTTGYEDFRDALEQNDLGAIRDELIRANLATKLGVSYVFNTRNISMLLSSSDLRKIAEAIR